MKKGYLAAVVGLGLLAALAMGLTLGQSVEAASDSGGVTASGNAQAKITLTLGDASMALGTPDPTCQGNIDGATVGEFNVYNGTSGNQGCAYVWTGLSITVKTNRAWTGTVAGSDGTPTSGVTVANGSFLYDTAAAATDYATCAADTALSTTPATFEASGAKGNNPYTHNFCVLIDWDDDDGSIDSSISYSVTQS